MTRTELAKFLQRQKYAVVSTLGDDGRPQAAVVGIATTDQSQVIFDTLGTSRKAHNLRRDGRVSLVAWEGEQTVQLEGIADEPSADERSQALDAYLATFPDGRERLGWPDITHFRIRPIWARFSDFGATPEPLIVEVD